MKNLAHILRKSGNQKGFSLVELLIVIAIMGVLAVIAFNAFSGVLTNSKRKADDTQAKNIEKAVRLLITDTGIVDITSATPKLYNATTEGTPVTISNNTVSNGTPINISGRAYTDLQNLVIALQKQIWAKDVTTGQMRAYGPYLDNTSGSATPTFDSWAPQWNTDAGGQYTGYILMVRKATNSVTCIPVTGTAGAAPINTVTSLAGTEVPGIIVN